MDRSPNEDQENLRSKTVKGGVFTIASQILKFVLQLGSTAILARLLAPFDFGLIAMATVVTRFLAMFNHAGLSEATIQRKSINKIQVSTLFWMNLILGFTLAAIVALFAPILAWFYGEALIRPIVVSLAISFVFTGLTVQHSAVLKRDMRFKAIAIIDNVSLFAGVVIASVMGFFGFGFWSLVMMINTTSLAKLLLTFGTDPWIPSRPKFSREVKSMLAFGGVLSLSSLLSYGRRNIDNLLIGAIWGPIALGYYSKAYQLLMMPIQQANRPFTNVIVPALSRLQDHPERFNRYYQKAILLLTMVSLPIAGFSFAAAQEIVLAVLGPQWLEAVPYFQALAPAAFAGSLNGVSSWIFISTGKAAQHLRTQVVVTAIVVPTMLLGGLWGALGVAVGFSISYSLAIPFAIAASLRETSLELHNVIRQVSAAALATTIAGIATSVANLGFQFPPLIQLTYLSLIFTVCYLCAFLTTPQGKEAYEFFGDLIHKRVSRSNPLAKRDVV